VKLVERVDWFEDQLFRQNTHRQLIERLASKKFGISARQARTYIKAARQRWMAHRSENLEERRAELDGALREIQQKATRAGQYGAAVRSVIAQAQLHGAMSPAEVTVSGHLTATAEVLHGDPEKDRARLEELRKREAEKKGGA
jgi:uncharacterized protein (UPF0335 family)